MPRSSDQGIIQILSLILILAGIAVGVYLVGQRTNLLPKAVEVPSNQSFLDTSYNINVFVLKYFPLTADGQNIDIKVTGDVGSSYQQTRQATIDITNNLLNVLPKSTRYLGYKDPLTQPALNYQVVDTKEYTKAVPMDPVTRRPLYNQILTDHNICGLVDTQGVGEVWLWAYQGPTYPGSSYPYLSISESKMAGPFGDISNSYRLNDMPVCSKTYRVYTFNYGRGTAEALESWGHQIEAEIDAIDKSFFRNIWQGPNYPQTLNVIGRCGSIHNPPNAKYEYNRDNPTPQQSDCLDWNPDGLGAISNISCQNWGCTHVSDADNPSLNYMIWNWQNLPGRNNPKSYQGQKVRNLWDIHGNFDQVMSSQKSIFLPSPSPSPSPIPTSSQQYVKVLYPNGGETFIEGDKVKITWEATNRKSFIIDWSLGPGSSNPIISINDGNAREYNWTVDVGNFAGNRQAKIRIFSFPSGSGSEDASDNFFTVLEYSPTDSDNDGFIDIIESVLGTNLNKTCPSNSQDHAWPPDTNNNGTINGADVSRLVPFIQGTTPYDKRYDLNRDGLINPGDVYEFIVPYFLQECTAIKIPTTVLRVPTQQMVELSQGLPDGDSDKDNFQDRLELKIGTIPYRSCAIDSRDNAWPPDLNSDKSVDSKDASLLKRHVDKKNAYKARYDLDGNGKNDKADLEVLNKHKSKKCSST